MAFHNFSNFFTVKLLLLLFDSIMEVKDKFSWTGKERKLLFYVCVHAHQSIEVLCAYTTSLQQYLREEFYPMAECVNVERNVNKFRKIILKWY